MAILRVKDANGQWKEIPAIKGDKGDKGDKGETGAKGDKGDKGDKGEQGIQGNQGVQGIQGNKGDKGDNATINGFNAITLEGKNGIGVTINGNVVTLHSTGTGTEGGAAAILINRSTAVNESDASYSTLMARGQKLMPKSVADTTTDWSAELVNGAICWIYE